MTPLCLQVWYPSMKFYIWFEITCMTQCAKRLLSCANNRPVNLIPRPARIHSDMLASLKLPSWSIDQPFTTSISLGTHSALTTRTYHCNKDVLNFLKSLISHTNPFRQTHASKLEIANTQFWPAIYQVHIIGHIFDTKVYRSILIPQSLISF